MTYEGILVLRTLGFLKDTCWDGMAETAQGFFNDDMNSSYYEEGGALAPTEEQLNERSRERNRNKRNRDREGRMEDREDRVNVLFAFSIIALTVSCCVCTYFVLKNRKSILKMGKSSN